MTSKKLKSTKAAMARLHRCNNMCAEFPFFTPRFSRTINVATCSSLGATRASQPRDNHLHPSSPQDTYLSLPTSIDQTTNFRSSS